jgi:hypothetical protein
MKEKIRELIGKQSSSDRNEMVRRMRLHQGWWRACVLGVEEGCHPKTEGDTICSSVNNGTADNSNFLDVDARMAVDATLKARAELSKGMIDEYRLYNNLLSSQPLCFNFFGKLKYNLPLASDLLKAYFPTISTVDNIHFEFAPNSSSNGDNSAHDIAVEFTDVNGANCLIGIECKYTEPFSPKEYSKPSYKVIYDISGAFSAAYEDLVKTDYNQLFRNQLVAESALINRKYDEVYGALFCLQNDTSATKKGAEFQSMLKNGANRFKVITFQSFIEKIQKLDLDWATREWTMLLWARYFGVELSKRFYVSRP